MKGPLERAAVSERRLRVVHVITTLTTGGAERQLEAITARSRHDTSTVGLYSSGPVGEQMAAAGHPVEVLGMAGWRKAAAVPRLALRLRRSRPDVVHVHLLAAQLWGIPAARLARVPVVVSSEHSLMETTIEGRTRTPLLRLLYLGLERLTTRTVAVSATTRERLVAWGVPEQHVEVVDNGIDFAALAFAPEARAAFRAELGIAPDTVVVGAVGRLDPVKRLDVLVRGLAPLLRQGGAVLVIAGDGPLRAELEGLAEALGVTAAVRLLGPRRDVPRVLCGFDLLISPSRDETFGMAVVEALGSGLPVAYAQCPALDEIGGGPDWAVRLDPADESEQAELDAVSEAVEALCQAGLARRPVPPALLGRFGIAATASALDAVYERLAWARA